MGVLAEWDIMGFRPCPHCSAKCKKSASVCSKCKQAISPVESSDRCRSCSEPIQPHWKVCPACEKEIERAFNFFDLDGFDL